MSLNQELGENTALEAALGYYLPTEDKVKVKRIFTAAGAETTNKREAETEDKEDGFWQGDLTLAHDWGDGIARQLKTEFTFRLRNRDREKVFWFVFRQEGRRGRMKATLRRLSIWREQ